MAGVEAVDEGTEFPDKRKLDLPASVVPPADEVQGKSDSNKKQKLEIPPEENGADSIAARENAVEPEEAPKEVNAVAEVEEEDDDDDDEEDYNAELEKAGYEEPAIVDRKGKGIMMDDKGKGKMIAGFDDDDSDDEDDDGSSDDDSDGVDGEDDVSEGDDLLAEVDLDNILPSRTRRHPVRPGLRIAGDSDKGNNA